MVADEASRNGFRDFAQALEAALGELPLWPAADEQAKALRLSYEMALTRRRSQHRPRLRLVYSRD